MKNSFLALLVSASFFSCSLGGKLDGINPLGNGSMSSKLDGASWNAQTVTVINKSTGGQVLSVAGVSITAKTGMGINFDQTKEKAVAGKTYTVGRSTIGEITIDKDNVFYSTDNSNGTVSGSGKIILDKWDNTNISGTFSGTLYTDDLKKKIVVTEGTFSGKVGVL